MSTGQFYEGLETNEEVANSRRNHSMPRAPADELHLLTEAFSAIPNAPTRAAVLALVRGLVGLAPSNNTVGR